MSSRQISRANPTEYAWKCSDISSSISMKLSGRFGFNSMSGSVMRYMSPVSSCTCLEVCSALEPGLIFCLSSVCL